MIRLFGVGPARMIAVRCAGTRSSRTSCDSSSATVRELFWPRLGEAGTAAFDGAARLAAPVFEGKLESGGRAESVGAVLHGLYWFVAGLADRGALALVVDDAHLLDVASARFLLYLARRISSVPVLLVVAMRPADPVRLAELSQLAEQVLTLAPLTVQASATVVRRALGPRADEELCESCHDATHGNPFYLRELAAALRAEGERPSVDLVRRVRALGVTAIATNVLLRLARLGSNCERLARAVAILGPGASLRHVATLASLDRERAGSAPDAMRAADLLSDGLTLSFVHPIVNETIASQLPAARRSARRGGAAARGGRSSGGQSGRPPPFRRAVGCGGAARRALAEPPTQDDRLAVLLELGRAEAMLPMAQEFSALRDALELASDPGQRTEIALELALALFGVFRNVEARLVLAEALRREPDLDPQGWRAWSRP